MDEKGFFPHSTQNAIKIYKDSLRSSRPSPPTLVSFGKVSRSK